MENRKLTICFFGEAKKEDIFALRWAEYFSKKGHNVHLFSYSAPEKQNMKIKVYLIKKKFPEVKSRILNAIFNLPFILIKIRQLIKKINPDIVHAQCITSYGTLASLFGFHPFVATAYGSDILLNPKENLITKIITRYILKRADLITCDAEHMKEAMIELGAEPSKINVIYFGVDTEVFKPGEKDKELIKQWGFLELDKIIISLRSLEPIYNVESLVKAIPIVLKKTPEAKFIIAGDGSEREILKKIAEKLDIINNIKFVGWINKEELPRYLRSADIYVSTSLSDGGLSSATSEAMACGLSVVITDSGENKKWIEDGKDGFIVPKKNPELLAEKIIFLMEDENKRKEFGVRSRETIKERNDYYNEMAKMEKIYGDLVNR